MDNTRVVSITGAPNPEFDPSFQRQVVAHMVRDPNFFRTNFGWLKVEQFSLIECQLVLLALYEFYDKFRKVPSVHTLEIYLTDTVMKSGAITWTQEDLPNLLELLNHIHKLDTLEPEFYQAKLQQFVQEVKVYELMKEAQQQGFGNQSEMVLSGVEQIRRESTNHSGIVISSATVDDPELITTEEQVIRIPTGIHLLDVHLGGGLAPGELGMITACTGVGKTNANINFGLSGIIGNWRSLIITDEVPGPKMKRRFQAMSTGIVADHFKRAVTSWPDDVMRQYQFFLHEDYRWRGMDSFVDFSKRKPTVAEIEQAIINWREQTEHLYGKEEAARCRLVCVDWLDRISTQGIGISRNARSDELLTELPYLLGEIARRQDVAMWTATQGTREAVGHEVLNITHTSGAFHKNDALDVSLGLGRVNEDGSYNDILDYDEVINEDDDACPPVDRELVVSLMKGRESAKAGAISFKIYQGPSLRFWNSKNQLEDMGKLNPAEYYLYPERLLRGMGSRKKRVIL